MRTMFYKSHLFNDKLEVADRVFISNWKEGGKSKEAKRQKESECERWTVGA
jgi:hypothetical protein